MSVGLRRLGQLADTPTATKSAQLGSGVWKVAELSPRSSVSEMPSKVTWYRRQGRSFWIENARGRRAAKLRVLRNCSPVSTSVATAVMSAS